MPFLRPPLTDLRSQVLVDFQTAQGGDGMALLRRAVTRPLSWAMGALAHGLYGFLDWISLMSVPWTARGEYLEAWAGLVGLTRKPPVAFAAVATSFANVPTSSVPAGTAMSASGLSYVTTADAAADSSGTISVSFTSTLAGTGYDLSAGETIALASSIAGINAGFSVTLVTQPGIDIEGDDDFRARMLARYAAPPQGGDATDYVGWALAVPGVTRAWVNPLGMGAGTVVVYTMLDAAQAASGGFPQGLNGVASAETRAVAATGDQLTVANALYPLRPVTALVYSAAPVAYPVPFTIHCAGAVSSDLRAAVSAALDGAFLAVSTPLDAQLETSLFEIAIAAVPGMPAFTLLSPAATITAPLGQLPVRGTVTFV